MESLTEFRKDLGRYEYKQDENGYCYLSEEQLVNKLGKLEEIERDIGCPLEVRLKITSGTTVYTDWGKMTVDRVGDSIFTVENKGALINQFNKNIFIYRYSDHKKTWWLKKGKSE